MWDTTNRLSDAALPLAAAYAGVTYLREALAAVPFRADAPVVCVGSALVGGACKTPLALSILSRISQWRRAPIVHALGSGYGGSERGPLRVRLGEHTAAAVGDEALLLARAAPTWVGAQRRASAAAACADGAELLLMDDGLQHTGLGRDLSLLCLDESYLLGNGRVLPAGPLREPFGRTLGRSDAVVTVSPPPARSVGTAAARGASDAALRLQLGLPSHLPLLRASLEPEAAAADAIAGRRVLAFSGTARPRRFFDTLRGLGCTFAAPPRPLPDHAPLGAALLHELRAEADAADAVLVTTSKDAARLPAEQLTGVRVLPVRLSWREGDGEALDRMLGQLLGLAPRVERRVGQLKYGVY